MRQTSYGDRPTSSERALGALKILDPALGRRELGEEIAQAASVGRDLAEGWKTHFEALYDGELLYLDTHLARLLERLREHSAWEDMLVIITADHGEALGEHQFVGHSDLLYDVIVRVPLILRTGRGHLSDAVPPRGSRWDRPMQLVDILPLALTHAGIDTNTPTDGTRPDVDAVSLRAWAFPSPPRRGLGDRFRRELRSIELAGWKLIEDHMGNVELYNVRTDSRETIDLAEQRPEQVDLLRAHLGPRVTYRDDHPGDEPTSLENLERLRSLGYIR